MNAKIYGNLTKPAVVLVGTWDPFVSGYYSLLDHVNLHCVNNGFEVLAVLLDPPPVHLLHNKVLPIFDCCATRIKFLQSKCHGAVCRFSMIGDELGDGVEDFLGVFFKQNIEIAELWLYEGQTMGRGGKSNIRVLTEVCLLLNIRVVTIPQRLNCKAEANDAKQLLIDGQVEKASEIVGHIPFWERPSATGKTLDIGWKTGIYEFTPAILSSGNKVQFLNQSGLLEIYHTGKGNAVFDWPDIENNSIAITKRIEK